MGKETKYCHNCGTEIDKHAVICPSCGVQQVRLTLSSKNEGVAAVLSFFITGAGQIYNGRIGKGILFFIAMVISWILCSIVIGVPMLIIIWIFGICDAYDDAKKINAQLI